LHAVTNVARCGQCCTLWHLRQAPSTKVWDALESVEDDEDDEEGLGGEVEDEEGVGGEVEDEQGIEQVMPDDNDGERAATETKRTGSGSWRTLRGISLRMGHFAATVACIHAEMSRPL